MKMDLAKVCIMASDKLLCCFGISEALYHVASRWFIITAINTTSLFVFLGVGQIFKLPGLSSGVCCLYCDLEQPARPPPCRITFRSPWAQGWAVGLPGSSLSPDPALSRATPDGAGIPGLEFQRSSFQGNGVG